MPGIRIALAAALCLIAVSPGRLRAPAAVGGGGLALGVGYSVLLLGWHFPSDVLAGFCVAAVWTVSGSKQLRLAHAVKFPCRRCRRTFRPAQESRRSPFIKSPDVS